MNAALFLFLEASCLGVFAAQDLIVFFVFFDLSIVGMYFVIAGWGHAGSARSALKFFLYTFVGSIALLLGFIGLFAGSTPHTFDMAALAADPPLQDRPVAAGLVLAAVLIGLAIKTPTVPFHTWLPPAHTDAPAAGSAVLAGVMLKMGTYGFLRIAMPMLPAAWRSWSWVILGVGIVSVLYGALVALGQADFKRMVAYTSVNHMGYVVLAVGAAGLSGAGDDQARQIATTGAVVQMVSHGLITGALFLLAGPMWERTQDLPDGRLRWSGRHRPPLHRTARRGCLRLTRTAGVLRVHRRVPDLRRLDRDHADGGGRAAGHRADVGVVATRAAAHRAGQPRGSSMGFTDLTAAEVDPRRCSAGVVALSRDRSGSAPGRGGAGRGQRRAGGVAVRPAHRLSASGWCMTDMAPAALLPEIAVILGALAVLIAGSFLPRTRQWVARAIAVGALLASVSATAVAMAGPDRSVFGASYRVDLTTGVVRLIVAGATLLVIWLGSDELAGDDRESETYTLLLLAAAGSMVLGGTDDLLVLAVGFLIASIPLYGLIGLTRDRRSAEATLKTYLIGALLGIVMLLGTVVLTGVTGVSTYPELRELLPAAPTGVVAAGAVAVLAGLMFKAGAVPAHFWVPDATQAASVTAAAFLTTVPKIGAVVAVARLVDTLPVTVHATVLVGVVATLTMTLGNFAAFGQQDARRLLGWSTVSQVGYLLVPAALGLVAAPVLLFYLGAYAVTNLAAFAVVAAEPTRRGLDDYLGFARDRPVLAAQPAGESARPGRHTTHGGVRREAHGRQYRRHPGCGVARGGTAGQHRDQPLLLPALGGSGVPRITRPAGRGHPPPPVGRVRRHRGGAGQHRAGSGRRAAAALRPTGASLGCARPDGHLLPGPTEDAQDLGRFLAGAAEPVWEVRRERSDIARPEAEVVVADHAPQPTGEHVDPLVTRRAPVAAARCWWSGR